MINRLVSPNEGRIFYEGTDVTGLKGRGLLSWRATCAMVFQQFNLIKRLDVLSNVLVGAMSRYGLHRTSLSGIPLPLEERKASRWYPRPRRDLDQALQAMRSAFGGPATKKSASRRGASC